MDQRLTDFKATHPISGLARACLAELDIIASAEGRLVPLGYTKLVQPADAGVVIAILVKDGDVVSEGQVLLRLDPRLSHADVDALGTDVAMRRLALRRIEAELAERPLVPRKDEPPELYAQVEGQLRARRQAFLDAVAQENEALNKATAELQAAQQLLAKLTDTLPSYRQSADAYRQLKQEGFVGELAAVERQRELVEKEQDQKTQVANVGSLEAAIAQSAKKLLALRSQYRSQLEDERVETLALLNRSQQELDKSNIKAGMLEIRAPHGGVVNDLAVNTVGGVVAAGAALMNIVPVDQPLQAEVLLRNEDVGFVAAGQEAKLKVAAYPFQKYGLLPAKVLLVSADAADPRQVPAGQAPSLTYRAMLKLDGGYLTSAATQAQLALTPGMLVTAEIHQGERSVMEYLLSPVMKVAQESARER